MDNPSANSPDNSSTFKLWLKRVGIGGFLFFLIKGIAWLFVFAAAGKCALG